MTRKILHVLPAAALLACGDDGAQVPDDDANSGFDQTESESLLIGKDFGITTDIQSGPNGNLFVVSLSNGAVYEIKSKPGLLFVANLTGSQETPPNNSTAVTRPLLHQPRRTLRWGGVCQKLCQNGCANGAKPVARISHRWRLNA